MQASKIFPAPSERQPAERGTSSACLPLSAEAANFTTFSACLIDAGLWWCCGLPILLMVKFYMFAGYSCYYKKGVSRGIRWGCMVLMVTKCNFALRDGLPCGCFCPCKCAASTIKAKTRGVGFFPALLSPFPTYAQPLLASGLPNFTFFLLTFRIIHIFFPFITSPFSAKFL